MGNTIGNKIELSGEKEFRSAISQINQQMKTLGTEMKLATSSFDANEKSVESLTAKNKVLEKQIETQKEKVDTLKEALKKSSEVYGENDTKTQKWQQKLNLAQANLNKMEKELNSNNKAIDEMGKASDESADDVKDLSKQVKSSADTANNSKDKFKALGNTLKNVGAAIAATSAAIGAAAVAAGKQVLDMASNTASAGDEIDKASQKAGISAEAYQQWGFVLEHNGASIDSMSTFIKKMNNNLDDAKNGSDSATEKFERLGLSVDDLSQMSSEDAFSAIITGLQGIADESERSAMANDILGGKYTELGPLLNQTAESTEALKQQANDLGLVMSNESVAASAAYEDSLTNLKGSISGAANSMLAEFLPGITQCMDGLTGLITGQEGAKEQLQEGIASLVGNINETIPAVIELVKSSVDVFVEVAPEIFTTLINGITENLPSLIDSALEILMSLAGALIDNLPTLLESALQIVVTLAKGIADSLPTLVPTLVDTVIMIVETLIDNVDMLIDASMEIIMALAEGLINALPKLIEKAPVIIEKLISAIARNLPKILKMGIDLTVELGKGLINAIPQITKNIPRIITSIVTGLKDGLSSIKEVGKYLIEGLWNGISDMTSWIKDKIKGFGSSVVDGLKSFFGIHSPSKLMEDEVGTYLAQGVGEGFTSQMDAITKDMADSMPTSLGDLDVSINRNVNTNYSSDASTSGYPAINITINPEVSMTGDMAKFFRALIKLEKQNYVQTGNAVFVH